MSSPSPSPAPEDNLRRLLDQRAARAVVHRTRSPSLTEFSDSPSIYSHPHFSPRPPHLDGSPPQFDFAIPPHYARPSFESVRSHTSSTEDTHGVDTDSVSPVSDTERSPSPSHSVYPDDEQSEPRMSFLGPTMRFHSPAPWETEDSSKDGVEREDDARSIVTKRSRSKTRGDGFMKSFGRTTPAKAILVAARPSFESTNGKDKISLDSQIAHTNLPAQSQATGFATQPATSSSRPSRPGLIFSRGRSRTVSHSATPDTSIPPPPPLSPSMVLGSTYPSAASPVPTRSASPDPSMYSRTMSPIDVTDVSRPASALSLRGRPDFVHPYANPDLAYDAGPVHTTTSFHPSSSLRRVVVPSDSIATVSESGVSQSSSTLTPDSSMSSVTDYHADVLLKKAVGSVQGKVISSPLPAAASFQGQKPGSHPNPDKGPPPLPNHGPGWTELSASPMFNLITLEEAQAQARERSRTQTQVVPGPLFLQTEPLQSRNNPTALPSGTGRLRSRTASAGSKSKVEPFVISNPMPLSSSGSEDSQAGQINPTGSLPRAMKHKKSGFMRLFNANGRDKDKPPSPTPPSAPPVAPPSILRTPKISCPRVPVPSLSPSLISQSPLQLDSIVKDHGGENDAVEDLQHRGNTKRQGPALSIRTQESPSIIPPGSQSARAGVATSPLVAGIAENFGLIPASAPPSTTTFSGLNLRPVSTLFSAHFADHIVSIDSSSPVQTDGSGTIVGGSATLTPSSLQRFSDEKPAAVAEDNPYLIIQQLQEQMKSTRKAWQRQIWELEGQVRDLRAEIDELRLKELRGERCLLCGRCDDTDDEGVAETSRTTGSRNGVVDRPRARTGVGTRFGAAA
ncbi:hypothetical protein F5148DRAFT_449693 [Russula earlei]|uniref:Uncharacterized protein n=1 Tax=Russula earlei TaxID=71964 RepID=A0ACC0U064_9AGAM|nr:hypothetical protein F5148DRAFT_449693 [Russula earlei]